MDDYPPLSVPKPFFEEGGGGDPASTISGDSGDRFDRSGNLIEFKVLE